MSNDHLDQITIVFEQLRTLRSSLLMLQETEEKRVHSLRGHQTVDDEDSLTLSFVRLQSNLADSEEVLAAIAEAMGAMPKL